MRTCTTPAREQIASYVWDLSDGRTDRISRVVNRRYGAPGTFPATLTVTTLDGATDTTTMNVIVQDTAAPPTGGGGGGAGGHGCLLGLYGRVWGVINKGLLTGAGLFQGGG